MSGKDDDADGLRVGGWLSDSTTPGGQPSGPAIQGAPPPDVPDTQPDPQPRSRHAAPETSDDEVVDAPYEGRRRAEVTAGWRRPVVVAALAGLVMAVTVPLAIIALSPSENGVAATASSGSTSSSRGVVVAGTWSSSSSVATATANTTAPAPSPGTSRTPSQASRSAAQSPSATPSPAVFVPVTYEAEAAANSTNGSAWVANYGGASGGKIVRNIGDWGDQPDGTLTFAGVTVPAAKTYTLTVYYVHIDNDSTRTAFITVPGANPVAVTVVGGSACCASKAISVNLRQGSNTIVFANPGGHAPSIDKIVISAN